jgi:hypothetical protein
MCPMFWLRHKLGVSVIQVLAPFSLSMNRLPKHRAAQTAKKNFGISCYPWTSSIDWIVAEMNKSSASVDLQRQSHNGVHVK